MPNSTLCEVLNKMMYAVSTQLLLPRIIAWLSRGSSAKTAKQSGPIGFQWRRNPKKWISTKLQCHLLHTMNEKKTRCIDSWRIMESKICTAWCRVYASIQSPYLIHHTTLWIWQSMTSGNGTSIQENRTLQSSGWLFSWCWLEVIKVVRNVFGSKEHGFSMIKISIPKTRPTQPLFGSWCILLLGTTLAIDVTYQSCQQDRMRGNTSASPEQMKKRLLQRLNGKKWTKIWNQSP